jgi:hypothetical protein
MALCLRRQLLVNDEISEVFQLARTVPHVSSERQGAEMGEAHEGRLLEFLKAIVGQRDDFQWHIEEGLLANEVDFVVHQLHMAEMLEILECSVADVLQLIVVEQNLSDFYERVKGARMNHFDLIEGEIELDENRETVESVGVDLYQRTIRHHELVEIVEVVVGQLFLLDFCVGEKRKLAENCVSPKFGCRGKSMWKRLNSPAM